jgi:hypothetical protein
VTARARWRVQAAGSRAQRRPGQARPARGGSRHGQSGGGAARPVLRPDEEGSWADRLVRGPDEKHAAGNGEEAMLECGAGNGASVEWG